MEAETDEIEVINRINRRFDKLTSNRNDGSRCAHVCIVCDRMLKPEDVCVLSTRCLQNNISFLTPTMWNAVRMPLAECYRYNEEVESEGNREWIQGMMLSPRATFICARDRRCSQGYSSCAECKRFLCQNTIPKYAIANNYAFGTPPICLLELTDIELSLLTPIKSYGYCFCYTGGFQKQLKGSLSYFKVDINSIVRSVMHFDVLNMQNNVVVMLYGNMTPEQKRLAQKKNRIRVNKVLAAMQWLLLNNDEWLHIEVDLNEVRRSLRNPVLVDNSQTESGPQASENNNIETTETFQVFFPDGTASQSTGGQSDLRAFQEMVDAAKRSGFDIQFRCNLLKEAVSDFKDSNLVNACLLQFPFGRGGMHETRQNSNGSFSESIDIADYVQHLSMISQPHFHKELFCLVLYNLHVKQKMVRSAGWRSRTNLDARTIAEDISADDITAAVNSRRRRYQSTNRRGESFLKAVDVVTAAAPHSNEATKHAKRRGEAMQHAFGMAHYFLTVTPDDDNNFIIQAYTGIEVDDNTPIASLTNYKLAQRAKRRTELRLRNPGICAFYFELALEIVIEEVLGWDLKKEAPREDFSGLFGEVFAFVVSIEEQGRKTLHAHIQCWVKQFARQRENLHSQDDATRNSAKLFLARQLDKVASCKFMATNTGAERTELARSLCHDCESPHPVAPQIVDDQQLRYLRDRFGQNTLGGMFAYCPKCTKSWTITQFVEAYLKNRNLVQGLTAFPDNKVRRLKAMAVEHQRSDTANNRDVSVIVEAAYNLHCHNRASCFNKSSANLQESCKRAKRKIAVNTDCRYRMPRKRQKLTTVQNVTDDKIKWFKFDGSFNERCIKEIVPRRHRYDAFQNVSCRAISHSKLTCNTNFQMIMEGLPGQYCFKYMLKCTQKDDTEEYCRLERAMHKTLSSIRRHESDRSESVRRLLIASFAHQRVNVVGCPLASYLCRHHTRFIFSHSATWCPLRDLNNLLLDGEVSVSVCHNGAVPYYQAKALHYICRPLELESCSPFDFYSNYEVINANKKNRDNLLQFHNHDFEHPSFRTRVFLQGVRPRNKPCLIRLFQYDFPDTAEFKGCLLDRSFIPNESAETFCKLALLLFTNYRRPSDIICVEPYTSRFRHSVENGTIGNRELQFLQNIQDVKSNCWRSLFTDDALARCTEQFKPADTHQDSLNDDENEDSGIHGEQLDEMIRLLDNETTSVNRQEEFDSDFPPQLSFKTVRNKGTHKCGYEQVADIYDSEAQNNTPFLSNETQSQQNNNEIAQDSADHMQDMQHQEIPSVRGIVSVLLQRTSRRMHNFQDATSSNETVNVLEANGSVKSIIDWARISKLDSKQKRAFEILAGTFVMSFYAGASSETESGHNTRNQVFLSERLKLKILLETNRRSSEQLILFLHGPGGSGKSTVVDRFMEYAKEFCEHLEYRFTSKTIVVTAMSGVAATILRGETTHKAVYLNQKKSIQPEQIEAWEETRMLIIDEISFAGKEDFAKMHENLSNLKQNLGTPYGGLHIVFAGDLRQLEPVSDKYKSKKPVYAETCVEFKDWVNCYIELEGTHRFKDDPMWGRILLRFRNGTVTTDDIDKVNERIANRSTVIPKNIRYATYFNRDRDSINTALFEERCKARMADKGNLDDSILILCDQIRVRTSDKTYQPFHNCRTVWQNCGENDIKMSSGRMDPLLRLYVGCRLMLTENISVKDGLANGTQAILIRIVLKHGVTTRQVNVANDLNVQAVYASEVSKIVLRHINDRISPHIFSIKTKSHSFKARVLKPRSLSVTQDDRETLSMKASQIPTVINNATTGHKLQGSGVETLFVHSWSYVTNWVYVMLSRVKTRNGLFARHKLSKDLTKYQMPTLLIRMMSKFERKAPTYWTEEEYEEKFGM